MDLATSHLRWAKERTGTQAVLMLMLPFVLRKQKPIAHFFLVALLMGTTGGCSSEQPLSIRKLPEQRLFVAMERDLQDFQGWGSVSLSGDLLGGLTHPEGDRRAFVNAFPPTGEKSFPVGTIIVQRTLPQDNGQTRYFAMVKRGGDFNAEGAKGWEWFELDIRDDDSVGISWRGLGAPDGDSYGGDPSGTCNSCHRRARRNDYVQSSALRL